MILAIDRLYDIGYERVQVDADYWRVSVTDKSEPAMNHTGSSMGKIGMRELPICNFPTTVEMDVPRQVDVGSEFAITVTLTLHGDETFDEEYWNENCQYTKHSFGFPPNYRIDGTDISDRPSWTDHYWVPPIVSAFHHIDIAYSDEPIVIEIDMIIEEPSGDQYDFGWFDFLVTQASAEMIASVAIFTSISNGTVSMSDEEFAVRDSGIMPIPAEDAWSIGYVHPDSTEYQATRRATCDAV